MTAPSSPRLPLHSNLLLACLCAVLTLSTVIGCEETPPPDEVEETAERVEKAREPVKTVKGVIEGQPAEVMAQISGEMYAYDVRLNIAHALDTRVDDRLLEEFDALFVLADDTSEALGSSPNKVDALAEPVQMQIARLKAEWNKLKRQLKMDLARLYKPGGKNIENL